MFFCVIIVITLSYALKTLSVHEPTLFIIVWTFVKLELKLCFKIYFLSYTTTHPSHIVPFK